ncbi:MAG: site-2 protease family protein [Desulfomonilia bacterium]|jgi:Zn-dependent protease/CBS domain-containing protein|nr:site-2 protease family protein [Deltaproteobacteria bacterium]MDX9761708.1 site-2 protease family protein [Desulfomonilia bacterium]
MFGRRIQIFRLFGFTVYLDLSWVIIAVLITWTLAAGFFPYYYQGFSTLTYWIMGVIGALGLFFSIIFHEMSHSLVSREFGLEIRGITLFVFGGVSEMNEEPNNSRTEFFMAVAGPLSSIFLGFVFYGVYRFGIQAQWPAPVGAVFNYLAVINFVLAAFNLVPAYPLDGGRVLRSALWKWKGNLRWATRIASRIGAGFGLALIFLGVLNIITGNFIGGMWWVLIGLFLRSASQTSYTQLLMQRALSGETVRRFMKKDPVSVSPAMPLDQLIHDYFYKYHYKMFPVQDNAGNLEGCITLDRIKEIPREEWGHRHVEDIVSQCSEKNTVEPSTDAMKVMARMNREGVSRLLVTDHGRLEGIVTLRDLFSFISMKMDLEGEDVSRETHARPPGR